MIIQGIENLFEAEHIQREIEAERKRYDGHHGNQHVFDKVVEPGDAKHKLLLVAAIDVSDAIAVLLNAAIEPSFLVKAEEMGNHNQIEDDGQLEEPPEQNQQGHEDETDPGNDGGDNGDAKRNPADNGIDAFHLAAPQQAYQQLPHGGYNQQGRQEEVHHVVGQEKHTAVDGDDGCVNSRQIVAEGIFELFWLEAIEQCNQECYQEP